MLTTVNCIAAMERADISEIKLYVNVLCPTCYSI